MHLRLLCLCLLVLGGCGSEAMHITVEISHQVRCSFVRYRGTWQLEAIDNTIPVEQCRRALERVLQEWEQVR